MSSKINQSDENKKNEESLHDMWNIIKHPNTVFWGVLEGEIGKSIENPFNEIIVDSLQVLQEIETFRYGKLKEAPNRLNSKRFSRRHIVKKQRQNSKNSNRVKSHIRY